jgi:4-hydroxybenzoate polyprenyltransferase
VTTDATTDATTGASRRIGWRAKALASLALLRPRQWSKNGLVLLALIFSGALSHIPALTRVGLAFLAFCLLSSVVYIINDLADRQADAQHPRKRLRPLAAGTLTPRYAIGLAALCLAGVVALSLALSDMLAQGLPAAPDPYARWGGARLLLLLALIAYLAIHIAYSLWLKHLVLWDVLAIASGFVLRALVGAFAIPAPISPWFYICTTFLALFLALGKRRAELLALGERASEHRQILSQYPLILLDQLLTLTATCSLVTYSLYTFQGAHSARLLMLTIPIALFGVMRYLYLIYARAEGERPEALLLHDPQIRGCLALYLIAVVAILYALPA